MKERLLSDMTPFVVGHELPGETPRLMGLVGALTESGRSEIGPLARVVSSFAAATAEGSPRHWA